MCVSVTNNHFHWSHRYHNIRPNSTHLHCSPIHRSTPCTTVRTDVFFHPLPMSSSTRNPALGSDSRTSCKIMSRKSKKMLNEINYFPRDHTRLTSSSIVGWHTPLRIWRDGTWIRQVDSTVESPRPSLNRNCRIASNWNTCSAWTSWKTTHQPVSECVEVQWCSWLTGVPPILLIMYVVVSSSLTESSHIATCSISDSILFRLVILFIFIYCIFQWVLTKIMMQTWKWSKQRNQHDFSFYF